MIIRSAEYIISAVQPKQFPKSLLPEFAFIGRSNVGKSSLINMLTNRKLLAKTSGRPGKTRTLNFFTINNEWNLVDMPGYGYARASKTDREKFVQIINSYLRTRKSLVYLFILIDSRHLPLAQDMDFIIHCAEMQLPFVLVFTKTDKCSKPKLDSNIAAYSKKLNENFESLPPIFLASSMTRNGRDELLAFIFEQYALYADMVKKLGN
jgi:GTP-binding protein